MSFKLLDKTYSKKGIFHPFHTVLLIVLTIGFFLIFLVLDFPSIVLYIFYALLFLVVLGKLCVIYLRKEVEYIDWNDKKHVVIKYNHKFKSLVLELPKKEMKMELISVRGSKNQLIGFEIKLTHLKNHFSLSSKIFEPIELEEIFESLSSEVVIINQVDSEEALKQIKFQTKYLKN